MALSEDFLNEIRQRCDIESTVSGYVHLHRRGSNLVGLCPFHNEKTPSFTVYPETGSYYCFGCGNGGEVITFIRNIENLDYIEAVRFLASKAGLSLPDSPDSGFEKHKARLLLANKRAAKFFHETLVSGQGKTALQYLQNRGLSQKTIRKFGLGFAPDSWDFLFKFLTAEGFSEHELLGANLIVKNKKGHYYDMFRNRVIFPIIDIRGNVIAFGGRVMGDGIPKYLNTSDTPVFKKSKELFALNLAKNNAKEQLILAEGYMDVIALHQHGFTNAVATLGTSLTENQAKVISRYTSEVVVAYDSDEAGKKASARAIEILNKTALQIKVLEIKGGKDPDEFIKTNGPEKFKALLMGAENQIEYKILKAREKISMGTTAGKVRFLEEAAKILSEVSSPIERDVYAFKLADELNVDKRAILTRAEEISKQNTRSRSQKKLNEMLSAPRSRDTVNPEKREHLRGANAEEGLIALLLKNPDFFEYINANINESDFITQFNRRVFSELMNRLSQHQSIELVMLSESFNAQEFGRIVSIQTKEAYRANTLEECKRCILVILEEKRKIAMQNPAEMDSGRWAEYLKEIAKNKTEKQ